MKFLLRFTFLSLFVVSFFLITENAQAHPGNTDNSGGHTCRTNCSQWGLSYGEYHYHNSRNNDSDDNYYWQFRVALCKVQIENAQDQKPETWEYKEAIVEIDDECLNSKWLRIKEQYKEELRAKYEEERKLRLKEQREQRILNGVVFLTFLYLLFLLIKHKEDFFEFIGGMVDTSIKFRNKVIDIIKNGYSSLLRIAEITKINKLLKLVGKLLKFYGNIVAILFGFIALCIAIFVPASIYGAIGAFIFYFIAILLIDVLSLDVELVLSRMFEGIDVAGLNELATLLFGISGFIIGVVFFLIKNRQYIKDNYISEFKINYF